MFSLIFIVFLLWALLLPECSAKRWHQFPALLFDTLTFWVLHYWQDFRSGWAIVGVWWDCLWHRSYFLCFWYNRWWHRFCRCHTYPFCFRNKNSYLFRLCILFKWSLLFFNWWVLLVWIWLRIVVFFGWMRFGLYIFCFWRLFFRRGGWTWDVSWCWVGRTRGWFPLSWPRFIEISWVRRRWVKSFCSGSVRGTFWLLWVWIGGLGLIWLGVRFVCGWRSWWCPVWCWWVSDRIWVRYRGVLRRWTPLLGRIIWFLGFEGILLWTLWRHLRCRVSWLIEI